MCASEKSTLPPCIGCAAIWPRAGSFALASLPPRPRPFGAQRRHPASALCVPQPDHRQDKGHGRTSGQARQTPVRPSEGPRPGAGQERRSTLAPFARGNLLLVRKELIMWTSLPDSRRTARIAGAKPRNRCLLLQQRVIATINQPDRHSKSERSDCPSRSDRRCLSCFPRIKGTWTSHSWPDLRATEIAAAMSVSATGHRLIVPGLSTWKSEWARSNPPARIQWTRRTGRYQVRSDSNTVPADTRPDHPRRPYRGS